MEEIFKTINYNGTELQVSNNGTVIMDGKVRKHSFDDDGYVCCSVKTKDGWRKAKLHRLIALAFIPNPNNYPEVNHKDFDRTNYNIDNLEWCTHEYNVIYSNCNRPDYNGEKNPNFGNHKLSRLYAENKELAKEKQSRAGIKNGRCIKISLYCDDVFVKKFDYIGLCCEYMIKNNMTNCKTESNLRNQICVSIKKNRKYNKHYSFVKE